MRRLLVGIVVLALMPTPAFAASVWSKPAYTVSGLAGAPTSTVLKRPMDDPLGLGLDFDHAWGWEGSQDGRVLSSYNIATIAQVSVSSIVQTSAAGSPYFLNTDGESFAAVDLVTYMAVPTGCDGFAYARPGAVETILQTDIPGADRHAYFRSYQEYADYVGRPQAESTPTGGTITDGSPNKLGFEHVGAYTVGRVLSGYREAGVAHYRVRIVVKHIYNGEAVVKEVAFSGTGSSFSVPAVSSYGPSQYAVLVWDENSQKYKVPGPGDTDDADNTVGVTHSIMGVSALTTDMATVKQVVSGAIEPEFDINAIESRTGVIDANFPSEVTSETVEGVLDGSPFGSMFPSWGVQAADWISGKIRGLSEAAFGGLFWWADEIGG